MHSKKLLFVFALAFAAWAGSPDTVRAGGPSTPSAIGGATVRGIVKFQGKAPKDKAINMSADPVCARQHPASVSAQEIVADAKGDLQNVIVYIADGLGDRTFDPPMQAVTVQQKGCMYLPHVLAVRANQPLHVVNEDATSHNIHPTPANNREWNKAEPPGTSLEEAFAREEIAIPVRCNLHPWMHGYIAVFKHPYFAVTGKDGSFDLSGLPPGTYTIKAWHEKFGTSAQTITIGASETKQVDFVFKAM